MLAFLGSVYVAGAAGHFVWMANLFRRPPWPERLEELRDKLTTLEWWLFLTFVSGTTLIWPIMWPWMARDDNNDDGDVP